jgi:dTDP-4-amino-4,6-dideoxygalactose transaminase
MRRVIGGVFGLAAPLNPAGVAPVFLKGNSVLLANARSGLWLLIQHLAPLHIWLPSYGCDALLGAIDQRRSRVRFYAVDERLAIPSLAWTDDIQRGDLVVLIDYFGFPCCADCVVASKSRGAWVVEDACQALLSARVGDAADFVLFSPRKFLGVPDGGILRCAASIASDSIRLSDPPMAWWLEAFTATLLRREFDQCGGERRWFELFQRSEAAAPIGAYAMSQLAHALLSYGFDYPAITRARVENYQRLAASLSAFALFPELAPAIVPLGFPIRVRNRDEVRAALFAQDIYPPIHWQVRGWVPETFTASHALAEQIMTLPCDQRYTAADMDRIAEIVLRGARR